MCDLSLGGLDDEEDRLGDGFIEELEKIGMKLGTFELEVKDLDFRDLGCGGEADSFRSELGMPEDLLDLAGEEIFEPRGRMRLFQDLALGDGAIDESAGWEIEHREVSWDFDRPGLRGKR